MSSNSANLASNLSDPNPFSPIQSGLDPHRYDDLINFERPMSQQHPPMSLANRAAQFAPFAALTGYHETIKTAEQSKSLTDSPRIDYNQTK